MPDILSESQLDESGLPAMEISEITSEMESKDNTDMETIESDLNSLAEDAPTTTQSLIEEWEKEKLAEAPIDPEPR
ncbi:MAG: hypothetical protein LRY63_08945 [Nitrincola sp.]|nr:hypothetical protein [Nitrincola sp.]